MAIMMMMKMQTTLTITHFVNVVTDVKESVAWLRNVVGKHTLVHTVNVQV
jgi:hypothetical protein